MSSLQAEGFRSEASRDIEEKFQLARKYLRGDGVEKDASHALTLMEEAATRGHPDAMGGVGFFYAEGLGVARDPALATSWYRMGAENGSAKSMYNLGQNLLRGRGVEKNTQEGLQWLEKASSQGLPEAQLACGEIYFWGTDNQPRDFVKAFPYFQNAAKSDVLKAQNLLGLCYRDGFGTSTDHQLAEEWFRRAAERNDPKAQSNLAHLLGVTSAGLDQSPKKVEALKWLIISSNQKEITAVKSLNVIRPTLDPKLLAAGEKAASDFEMQQSLSENR